MVKKILIAIIIIIIALASLIYHFFYSMSSLPEGNYLFSSVSQEAGYKINVYVSETSLSQPAVRCELENLETHKTRNIYWEYKKDSAEIEWLDNNEIIINGKQFNYLEEKYDWRRDESVE